MSLSLNQTRFTKVAEDPFNSKEAMRRSRTTRHETLGKVAWFFFSVAVPDDIYTWCHRCLY
jgi:hypothetical protein